MTWHFEAITVTCRRYAPGRSFEMRDKYTAVATVQILGGKRGYLSAFLADGRERKITREEWEDLGEGLRVRFGVVLVESERHGVDRSFDTGPAPLD